MAADLLRVREAAEMLGFSVAAIRLWEASGQLPSLHFASAIRFERATLERVKREGLPRKAKVS
jgi:DNA-binding transcriptional MerR regulator